MAKRKKAFRVSVKFSAGIAPGILALAEKAYKNPEYMKAFQEWQAEQERGRQK